MRVVRITARAIGWLFVAVVAYHAALAAAQAVSAAHHGNRSHAAELAAYAVAATLLVAGAVVGAVRGFARTPKSRTP